MAITGPTPTQAIDRFIGHLNNVLRQTITAVQLRRLSVSGRQQYAIGFPEEDATDRAITIETRFGAMGLGLAQTCDTPREGREYRVRTREYAYSLTPGGTDHPWVRWEYTRFPTDPRSWSATSCRRRHGSHTALSRRPLGRPVIAAPDDYQLVT